MKCSTARARKPIGRVLRQTVAMPADRRAAAKTTAITARCESAPRFSSGCHTAAKSRETGPMSRARCRRSRTPIDRDRETRTPALPLTGIPDALHVEAFHNPPCYGITITERGGHASISGGGHSGKGVARLLCGASVGQGIFEGQSDIGSVVPPAPPATSRERDYTDPLRARTLGIASDDFHYL